MNSTTPLPERLIALSKQLAQAHQGRKGRKFIKFCGELCYEFGVTAKEIESIRLEPGRTDDEVYVFRRRVVKAGISALRRAIAELAIEKGLVSIGEPLPFGTDWNETTTHPDRKVLSIGTFGHFLITNAPSKGTNSADPVNNRKFLDMLAAKI